MSSLLLPASARLGPISHFSPAYPVPHAGWQYEGDPRLHAQLIPFMRQIARFWAPLGCHIEAKFFKEAPDHHGPGTRFRVVGVNGTILSYHPTRAPGVVIVAANMLLKPHIGFSLRPFELGRIQEHPNFMGHTHWDSTGIGRSSNSTSY